MNTLFAPGAKRTRFLVAFGLTLLLATPMVMIWAGKVQIGSSGEESQGDAALVRAESRWLSSQPLPEATMPPAEFSPFGGPLTPRSLSADKAAKALPAPTLGDVEWDPENDDVTKGLKPGLRWG